MESHLPLRALKCDKQTRALWSLEPSNEAVVFIHGYGGTAVRSWSHFHRLLPRVTDLKGTDFFFYGHNGLFANVIASAGLFLPFLETLFDNPSNIVNDTVCNSLARSSSFRYRKVTIVAHSLGAVITRWALLMARQKGCTWLPRTSMVLFAPAHMGARPMNLALIASGGFPLLSILTAVAFFRSPLIEELAPDSSVLQTLRNQTQSALSEGGCEYLIARKVIIGELERVVVNLQFCDDPVPIIFPGRDHSTVCKPSEEFLQPLTELQTCLS